MRSNSTICALTQQLRCKKGVILAARVLEKRMSPHLYKERKQPNFQRPRSGTLPCRATNSGENQAEHTPPASV